MECPNCHADTPVGETFCSKCGAYLVPAVAHVPLAVGASTAPAEGRSSETSGLLTPGTRLQNGRYVIEKVLGQGGMGAALLAKDTRVYDKPMVIKELITESTDPAQRKEDIRNFEQEVKTLVDLDHPLVTKVTDHFQEGPYYFMVQDYVAGENLEERMERTQQAMPEWEVLTYASQILDILGYLESRRPPIIHRDIKPANIIIGAKDKRAHLVDFGIIAAALFFGPYLLSKHAPGAGSITPPPSGNPISVMQVNGELLGISDGWFVFDTYRQEGEAVIGSAAPTSPALRLRTSTNPISTTNPAILSQANRSPIMA